MCDSILCGDATDDGWAEGGEEEAFALSPDNGKERVWGAAAAGRARGFGNRRRRDGGVRCSMTLNIIIAAHTETRVVAKHETVMLAAANILRGVDL